MSDSFQKDIVQESDYIKYLEELKEYYSLKKKYTAHKQTFINKLINSKDSSIDTKKKMASTYKPKCVNCGKLGGTVFTESSKMLRATCGNTSTACDLNIAIVKMNASLINKDLEKANLLLNNKKKDIVLTKLDYLFKYIAEDKAVELFEQHNNDRATIQDNYNNLLSMYNSIVDNPDTEKLINEKLEDHTELVNKHKRFMKVYNQTNEIGPLQDAVLVYKNELKQLDEFILNLKYPHNSIEFDDDDIKYLHQDKYVLTDLEVIKKPN
jgi:hypothetical protein